MSLYFKLTAARTRPTRRICVYSPSSFLTTSFCIMTRTLSYSIFSPSTTRTVSTLWAISPRRKSPARTTMWRVYSHCRHISGWATAKYWSSSATSCPKSRTKMARPRSRCPIWACCATGATGPWLFSTF